MKHLKNILIFAAIIGLAAVAGQDITINTGRLDGFIYGNKSGGVDTLIVPHADSLGQYKYQNASDPINSLDVVNLRTLLSSSSSGWDSIPFNPATGDQTAYLGAAPIYVTNFDGRYIELSDTTNLAVTITQLNDSIDVLNAKIESGLAPNIFAFTIPSGGSLSASVAAIPDVPSGWTITSSGNNVLIEHSIGKYEVSTMISNNSSGASYESYRPFNDGYSGIIDVDTNNLTIVGITGEWNLYDLRVQIIFEQ
jgi:hypothetical protein